AAGCRLPAASCQAARLPGCLPATYRRHPGLRQDRGQEAESATGHGGSATGPGSTRRRGYEVSASEDVPTTTSARRRMTAAGARPDGSSQHRRGADARITERYVVGLHEDDASRVDVVGGKGAGLAALALIHDVEVPAA